MWALFLLFINNLSHLKRGIKEVNCGFRETLLDSTSKKRYLFQSKMNSFFALSWLGCATALLLMAPNDMASNQMEIPLIYINSILMDNFTFENHAIQFVNVQDPRECFRHCAKYFDRVAFQVIGKICELLCTGGAFGNQVKRPGTVPYHIKQNGVRVRLWKERNNIDQPMRPERSFKT